MKDNKKRGSQPGTEGVSGVLPTLAGREYDWVLTVRRLDHCLGHAWSRPRQFHNFLFRKSKTP